MKRFTLSVSALSLSAAGLLFASACSTDDEVSDGAGGNVGSGGNTYIQGGNTNRGGSVGNGGAVGVGGAVGNGGAVGVGGAATGGKASTGGAANGGAATGGAVSTGGAAAAGTPGSGGTAGAATGGASTAGNAGKGGTAGAGTGGATTGGAATAGNAGRSTTAGSTSTGGTNAAGTAGTAGTAGAGTAGSGPACATDNATLAAGFCTPPASLANLPPMDGTIGNYHVNTTAGSAHIYNVGSTITTTPIDGDLMTGSPYSTDPCRGAGVNAAGKVGMSVTVTNNLAAPVDVLLYVVDQAGTAAPYTIVTMTGRTTIPASATNLTVQVPFVGANSAFTATCSYSSAIALNLATVRQVGIGFDSANNQVDVMLLGMAFY